MSRLNFGRSTTTATDETSSALHLRSDSPYRPINWRWRRATLMRENHPLFRCLPKAKDNWTRKAREYQSQHAEAHDEFDMMRLRRKWPHIFDAHQIQQFSRQMLRWELEARLLARDTLENIEQRLQVQPEVTTWYERLFFNISDRLDNRGYIAHNVLGESMHAGLTERDHDLLWKLYGYCGGVAVLDAVLFRRIEILRPEKADGVQAFVKDETENSAAIKSMLSMRTMPINSFTQMAILEIHQGFLTLKQNADSGGGASDSISINIQAMLDSLPWTIGSSPTLVSSRDPSKIIGRLPKPLADADQWAAELRAEEITEINVGRTPARMEQIQRARFPTPEEREVEHGNATAQ